MSSKREPSIHISQNNLLSILGALVEDEYITLNEVKLNELGKLIMTQAATLSLSHRAINSNTKKMEAKVEKVKASTRSNAALFSEILLLTRRKLKHRNISLIRIGTPEYLKLKEVAKLATEFCNEYSFKLKEGYIKYLEIYFRITQKYSSLNNIPGKHPLIMERYDSELKVERDEHKDLTKMAHAYYLSLISNRVGFAEGFEENPIQYCYFIDLIKECKKLGLKYSVWIDAQFDGFDWLSAIPLPSQLVGYKALQRVQRYCFKMNIRITQQSKVDFSKIRGK